MSECPHPEKIPHRSCAAALKARESLDELADLSLRPYRCGDHWHLGHGGQRKTFQGQLKRAIAQGKSRRPRRKR